jgi:hypothetical protein
MSFHGCHDSVRALSRDRIELVHLLDIGERSGSTISDQTMESLKVAQ